MRVLFFVVAMLALSFGLVDESFAERRFALVIGIDDYPALEPGARDEKAVADARAVADAFEGLGFEVTRGENLSRGQMQAALKRAARQLAAGDAFFFFFAGIGLSIDGENYLLPSDIPGQSNGEEGVRKRAIAEAEITKILSESAARAVMLVLDASRENPYSQGGLLSIGDRERGLSRPPEAPPGNVMVLYSADYGAPALPRLNAADADPNSLFTRVLLSHMRQPDVGLTSLARNVRDEVERLAWIAGHIQAPVFESGGIDDSILLAPTGDVVASAPSGGAAASAPPDSHCDEAAAAFMAAREVDSAAALDAFLQAFPACSPYTEIAQYALDALQSDQPGSPPALAAVEPEAPPSSLPREVTLPAQEPVLAAPPAEPAPSPAAEAETPQPQFPWPPPQASASYVIPRAVIFDGGDLTWGDLEQKLVAALDAAGYSERSVYFVPAGFAIATRLERIDEEGNPMPGDDRWPVAIGAATGGFSLADYISQLFFARAGYYRVIVFVSTPNAFAEAAEPPSAGDAARWVRSGLNTLPGDARALPYTPDFTLTALIYEFQHSSEGHSAEQLVPSRLPGRTHLERGQLVSLLGN
jgi:Caspase domain